VSLGKIEHNMRVARMLGYNPAKTKMLVGQWRLDLMGLERKLQHELDEGPQILPTENCGGKRHGRHNRTNEPRFDKGLST